MFPRRGNFNRRRNFRPTRGGFAPPRFRPRPRALLIERVPFRPRPMNRVRPPLPPRRIPRRQPFRSQALRENQMQRKGPVKKATTLINRIEKSSPGSSVVAKVATTPSMTSIEWDQTSLFLIIETLASYYAMESDLFSEITPQLFAYYCGYMCMAHFNNFGFMGNAGNLPTSTKNLKLAVPYALAKYLEYNSPYSHQGVSICNRWSYATSLLFGTATSTGLGWNTNVLAGRPPTFPYIQIFPMTTTTALGTVGAPQILAFPDLAPTSQFAQFTTNDAQMGAISNALVKRGNTVLIGAVGAAAPDSSAHSRPVVAGSGTGGLVSIDSNFDPELTLFFAPVESAKNLYNTTTRKSYPSPTFTFDSFGDGSVETSPLLYVPDFWQIASSWVHVCQHYDGPYKHGKIRDVFTVQGHKLTSLYPTEQPHNGAALGEAVQSAHAQIIAGKSEANDDTLDPENYNLTLSATVAYSGMQYRRNRVEVIHVQCPASGSVELTGVWYAVLIPQIMYVDVSWASVQSPHPAAVISQFGVNPVDGRLRIPLNNYKGLVVGDGSGGGILTPPLFIGPQRWSAIGLDDFEMSAAVGLTIPWGTRGDDVEGSLPPDIIWDNSTQPAIVCDSTFINTFFGYKGSLQLTYPIYPTAGSATCIQNQFKSWLQSGAFSQTSPLAQINSCDSGDITSMVIATSIDSDDATLIQAQPNGTPDTQNNTNALVVPPASLTSPIPRSSEDLAMASFSGLGDVDQVQGSNPGPYVHQYYQLKRAALAGTSFSSIPTSPPTAGAHMVDIPWSTGKAGLLSSIAQQLSSTSSPFAAQLASKQGQQAYDITRIVKRYITPALLQSMQSIGSKDIPFKQFLGQSKAVTKKESFGKKLIHFGTNVIEKVMQGSAHEVEKGVKSLFQDGLKDITELL